MTASAPRRSDTSASTAAAEPAAGEDSEHRLVAALRELVKNPHAHTVGGLAAIVESSLAELSLMRDRLDLIEREQAAAGPHPAASVAPPSGDPEPGSVQSAAKPA